MKKGTMVLVAVLGWALIAASLPFVVQAAAPNQNPTRGENPAPNQNNKQPLLLMPHILTIHDFTFTVLKYHPASTPANASGMAAASFGDKSKAFTFGFNNLSIVKKDMQHGIVTAGSIELTFNPGVDVQWKGFAGKVQYLYLDPGTDSVKFRVALPTLWTRSGPFGSGPPPRKAFLALSVKESNQNLELYLPNVSGHSLGVLGLGDTRILMDCTNVPLEVDLSQSLPAADPAGLSIGFKGRIPTVPQKEMADTNSGFCFGKYEANGGRLTSAGFKADFVLKEKWTYATSTPQGYEITLFPKGSSPSAGSSGQTGSSNAQPSLDTGFSASSLKDFSIIHIEHQPGESELSPSDLKAGGNNNDQLQADIAPDGTLRIINSAVDTATFSGSLRLPKTVCKLDGSALGTYGFSDFHVDAALNMRGNIKIADPVCWGGLQDGAKPVYGLKSAESLNNVPMEPPRCFFPGGDPPKPDLTNLNGLNEEEFVNQDDLWRVPGVTFLYFTLGIVTSDANHPIFIPNVLPPEYKSLNGPYWYFWQAQGGNNCWLNVGTAGINGKMDIITNIGLHQYPIKLGNPDPQYAKGNVPFQSYLHAYPKPVFEKTNKISGPFFHATFIDGAVFDLGINGHFRVNGPSCIDAEFENLSATSTADLTSAAVKFKGNLKYWGVELDTGDDSKIVPRVSQAFLLKATIGEAAHYEVPFPVVWGRMTGDGNIPEVIFGYGIAQSFDHIPYSYEDVSLSKWDKNDPESHWDMPPGERWGAIRTEGILSFPYFGPRKLFIDDYMHDYTDASEKARHESREILDNKRNELFFTILPPDRVTWGDPVTATFNFPKVPYYDGEEYEDGFGDPDTPLGTITFRDYKGGAPTIIHITGRKLRLNIPQDPNGHPMADDALGLTLNHLQSDGDIVVDNAKAEDADTIHEMKLKGHLDGDNSVVGGLAQDFSIVMNPLVSSFAIMDGNNDFNLTMAGIGLSGKVTTAMAYSNNLFTGTIFFNDVSLCGNGFDYAGHATGQFSISIGETAKYIQGTGNVTIYGVPWPIPDKMDGAFFLGYGANADDVYALQYIDSNVYDKFKQKIISGVYLAGKLSYEWPLGFFGGADLYCNGGTGYLSSEGHGYLIFHGGFGAGVEVIGIGLHSSTALDAFTEDFSSFAVEGTLEYELSLWFFDFSWSGHVWLDSTGPHI